MKSLFVSLFCLSNVFLMSGQYFDGGVFFGFAMSQVDGDTYGGYHQPGLTAGVYTSRDFSKNLKGLIELKYIAKGARQTSNKGEVLVYDQRLRYIEMPVKVQMDLIDYNSSIETGLALGYLFQNIESVNYTSVNDDYRKVELSWVIGYNYYFSEQASLAVQFSYSLLPIRKYENTSFNYGFLSRTLWMTKGDYNNVVQFCFYRKIGK